MNTPIEPKKAVTCILQRADGSVLLARRNDQLRFMAGHHVFPGGRIDTNEPVEHVIGAASPEEAAAVSAAAREVFEETGILCVDNMPDDTAPVTGSRRMLLEDRTTWSEILDRYGLRIPADRFEPAGVWVTPEFSPIRFDTQYFLYRVTPGQQPNLIDGEITALDWLTPAQARRRWHAGEIKLSTPVASTLKLLDAYPYPHVLDALNASTRRGASRPNRFEVRRGIYVLPLKTDTIPPATTTNCILIGEEDLLIIDPGAHDEGELNQLAFEIDHLAELGAVPKAVVLTHSHRDHVQGVPFLQERYALPIWAHPETGRQAGLDIDWDLHDGSMVELPGEIPWTLEALHTPGHDPGHLVFVEHSTATLICGDMVANPGTIVVSPDFEGNMDHFLDSLKRLSELPGRLLIPAHGRPMKDPADVFRHHLEHRLWREARIQAALDAGHTTLSELLDDAYDDVPEEARRLAGHALRAHLERLGASISG